MPYLLYSFCTHPVARSPSLWECADSRHVVAQAQEAIWDTRVGSREVGTCIKVQPIKVQAIKVQGIRVQAATFTWPPLGFVQCSRVKALGLMRNA
mmetsp:Transcript_28333/g.45595  ORF Transcript_28333/g.45595 Transcript_28333/m.45595 type:complete len:95 (+) Transcript_28333:245-529(+)